MANVVEFNNNVVDDGDLEIVKFNQVDRYFANYKEVFHGCKQLKVLTYSISLNFISKLLPLVKKMEVIIGAERMVQGDTNYLFAYQNHTVVEIRRLVKNKNIAKAIEEGNLKFYVTNEIINHEKLYLLYKENVTEAILGSANLSKIAWSGNQVESFLLTEDKIAVHNYISQYDTIKKLSDSVNDKYIEADSVVDEDNIRFEDLPIVQRAIKTQEAIVLTETKDKEIVDYDLEIERKKDRYKNITRNIRLRKKNGRIYVDAEKVTKIIDSEAELNKKKHIIEKRQPSIVVNYNENTLSINNKTQKKPNLDTVKNDLKCLLEYMDGFDSFSRDTFKMKMEYWKVLNWMFCSVFFGKVKYEGSLCDFEYPGLFPLFALMYGPSNGGKTKFVKTVEHLMMGKTYAALKGDNFTSKKVYSLQLSNKGIPILIDDITGKNFKFADDIVKAPYDFTSDQFETMPCFILTGNSINTTKTEISKRVFVCYIDNAIDKTTASKNERYLASLRQSMTNSFYIEYVHRMIPCVLELIEKMHSKDIESRWIPDLLNVSAIVIDSIMNDCDIDKPSEWAVFTNEDYMGEKQTAKIAKQVLVDEYERNYGRFKFEKKNDKVIIDFSDLSYEGNKKARLLQNELPASCECKNMGSKVVLKLSLTENFLGFKLKQKKFGLFGK